MSRILLILPLLTGCSITSVDPNPKINIPVSTLEAMTCKPPEPETLYAK